MHKKYSLQKGARGATLLIAVLMVSVVLAVGFGIYQRTYKSLVFSSFLKQSQIAFAAADSGLECAVYLDLHFSDTVTDLTCFSPSNTIQKANWLAAPAEGAPRVSKIFPWVTPSGGCVNIEITKPSTDTYVYTDPITSVSETLNYSTHIQARGYNDCNSSNPRRVERGLEINY